MIGSPRAYLLRNCSAVKWVSVIKRLSLYVFALWGRDLVSVVRIRDGPYYRILLGNKKLSVIERCPYQRGVLKKTGSTALASLFGHPTQVCVLKLAFSNDSVTLGI